MKQNRCFSGVFFCFFYDPVTIGNLISGSSVFSKNSLNIWKFFIHALLKPSLENLSITLLAWTMNFQMFKLDLEKAEEPEIKLQTFVGSLKKQDSSRKISTFALSTTSKLLSVWITINCGKFLKRWEYQTTLPVSWEICMQLNKLKLDMEQQTGSKLGKEYIKAVYCHPAYLTYMQSTSWEMLGWMKHCREKYH